MSFGFWNSSVLKNWDGVRTGGILGSSSWRRKGVPGVNGFGESAYITLLMGVWGAPGSGVFLFRVLDRLKVGVGKGGDELLVRMEATNLVWDLARAEVRLPDQGLPASVR